MDRTIKFCDVTLRDGEQTPGVHFTASQKLDIAKRLRRTGIVIIEAGFPASSAGDFEAVSAVAQDMANDDACTVSALARMTTGDIDAALSAVGHGDAVDKAVRVMPPYGSGHDRTNFHG